MKRRINAQPSAFKLFAEPTKDNHSKVVWRKKRLKTRRSEPCSFGRAQSRDVIFEKQCRVQRYVVLFYTLSKQEYSLFALLGKTATTLSESKHSSLRHPFLIRWSLFILSAIFDAFLMQLLFSVLFAFAAVSMFRC